MSLRIQNDAPGGINSQGINGTQNTGHANGAAGANRGYGISGSPSTDQVDVSDSASTISDGISLDGAQHSARVQQLSALYASGNYHVDAAKVSSAIVSQGITGTGGAGTGE